MFETVEGDFVIRGHNGVILRVHMTAESMIITACEYRNTQVIIADISEARELRDWITRRLDDPS